MNPFGPTVTVLSQQHPPAVYLGLHSTLLSHSPLDNQGRPLPRTSGLRHCHGPRWSWSNCCFRHSTSKQIAVDKQYQGIGDCTVCIPKEWGVLPSGEAIWLMSSATSPHEPLPLPSREGTSRSSWGCGLAHAVLKEFCWQPGLQRCHRSHLPRLHPPLDFTRTHLKAEVGKFRSEWSSGAW